MRIDMRPAEVIERVGRIDVAAEREGIAGRENRVTIQEPHRGMVHPQRGKFAREKRKTPEVKYRSHKEQPP
jgi:hypothetical protein